MVACGSYIYNVILQHTVIAARDDDLAVAFDGRHVQVVADVGHILEHLVDDACVIADFHAHNNQLTIKQLKPVSGPSAFQGAGDFLGGEHLGVDKVVDTQVVDVVAPFGAKELVIVESGHGPLGTEFFGHGASQDVACLTLGHSDEQVTYTSLDGIQVAEGDGATLMGEQVVVLQGLELPVLYIHDDDVLLLITEHLGKMGPDFSCAGNNDSHCLFIWL